jgi:hypothetical protein
MGKRVYCKISGRGVLGEEGLSPSYPERLPKRGRVGGQELHIQRVG